MAKKTIPIKVVVVGARADWMKSPATYAIGQAAVDEADKLAVEISKRWGEDRVRLLVSETTRAKFDSQRYRFNHANWNGNLEDIKREAARMCKAWRAVDAEARASGAEHMAKKILAEVTLASGAVAAIVENNDHAKAVLDDGRHKVVVTLAEVGRVITASKISEVKVAFPGAEVVATREVQTPRPDDDFWAQGDDIPDLAG